MGEIETKKAVNCSLRTGKKKRFNKKSTRVDLTPMVDLGFLLITFFVFTSVLNTPKVMNIMMPNDSDTANDPVCESCVLTVLLDKNDRIKYYEGALENNPPIKETGYGPKELRTLLMQKKAAVNIARGSGDQFILIIKSSESSSFKNFVDITDEVSICQIKRYYIDELSPADKNILHRRF